MGSSSRSSRSHQSKPLSPIVSPFRITWIWLVFASCVALVLSLVASHFFLSSPSFSSFQVDQTTVFIADDFFPESLVDEWKSRMEAEWKNGNWFFTTNNAGTFDMANLNQKVLSRRNVSERQEVALRLLELDLFAYRKWELERNNSVHLDMLRYLESSSARERAGKILGARIANKMGDFFVTLYAKDDFLSAHSDVYGGTWAVVVYLVDQDANDGGELSFFCKSTNKWCKKVVPKRNRLVMFRTRRPGEKRDRKKKTHIFIL